MAPVAHLASLPLALAGLAAVATAQRAPSTRSGGAERAVAVESPDGVSASVLVTASPGTRIRVIAPAAARVTSEQGGPPGASRRAPARGRGGGRSRAAPDTLWLSTPARFTASLTRSDVRIEAADSVFIDLDARVRLPSGGSWGHGGRSGRVYVLRAGGRRLEAPGRHEGIRELGGDEPPRDAVSPDSTLHKPAGRAAPFVAHEVSAWGGHRAATLYFARPDTVVVVELVFAAPAGAGRGPAERRAVGASAAAPRALAHRLTGPRAHQLAPPAAAVHPARAGLRADTATAGTLTALPVWRRRWGDELSLDSVAVTVERLVFRSGPSLRLPRVVRPVAPPPP